MRCLGLLRVCYLLVLVWLGTASWAWAQTEDDIYVPSKRPAPKPVVKETKTGAPNLVRVGYPRMYLGGKMNANFISMRSSEELGVNFKTGQSLSGGLVINLDFSPTFGLQIEPGYQRLVAGYEFDLPGIGGQQDSVFNYMFDARYFTIPLLARYQILGTDIDGFQLYGLIGLDMSFLQRAYVDVKANYYPAGLTSRFERTKEFGSANFGGILGLGIGVRLDERLWLGAEGRYSVGSSNFNKDIIRAQNGQTFTLHYDYFQASLRLSYRLF